MTVEKTGTGRFVNFSNHPSSKWTQEQIRAALEYGDTIADMPFPAVKPSSSEEEIFDLAQKTAGEILAMEPSAVMCQGEFGLCFAVTQMLLSAGIVVLYACSERKVHEKENVKSIQFDFVRFRRFEKY